MPLDVLCLRNVAPQPIGLHIFLRLPPNFVV